LGNEVGGAAPGQRALTSFRTTGRPQYWDAALDAYGSSPVHGVGAGNYELYWNAHPEVALPLVNAHSLYLETLAELGLAGLAVVLGFLCAPVVASWGRIRGWAGGEAGAALALLAAGALSAAIEWTWQLPAAFAPVVVAAGLLTATRARAAPAAPRAGRRYTGLIGAFALAAVGWASVWAAGVLVVGNEKLDSSRAAARDGELAAAADDARVAADVQPWSPEPRLQLALVDELAGDLGAARRTIEEAISRAPDDWRGWAVAARIDAHRGRRAAASRELARARGLNPVGLPPEFRSLAGAAPADTAPREATR
jgi:tetratricopeptide (TPR) repeat protein